MWMVGGGKCVRGGKRGQMCFCRAHPEPEPDPDTPDITDPEPEKEQDILACSVVVAQRVEEASEGTSETDLVHTAPENNHVILIVLKYSADPLKAVSGLRLVPYPRAVLKIRPPSSLDYRARHGPQTMLVT